jgi:hypothetical protein
MDEPSQEITMVLMEPPKPEGQYVIGDGYHRFCFSITKRPNIIHRWFTKLFLGWTWQDT